MKNFALISFVFLLIACGGDSLSSHSKQLADVYYNKDTITINYGKRSIKLHAKDGKYYTEDDCLFLSNSNDSIIMIQGSLGATFYVIKKDTKNNLYMTLCYYANNNRAVLVSQFCYDKNYNIKGIKYETTLEFY